MRLVLCKFQKDCTVYNQSVVTQTSDAHFYKGGGGGGGVFNDCKLSLISPRLHIFVRGFRTAFII